MSGNDSLDWSAALPTLLGAAAMALLMTGTPLAASPPSHAERMHALALESFRAGRFPEAYGRFIALAQIGHPASARYALWMCEHGLPLFGKNWDCSQEEVEDWARAARVAQFSVADVAAAADRATARRGRP